MALAHLPPDPRRLLDSSRAAQALWYLAALSISCRPLPRKPGMDHVLKDGAGCRQLLMVLGSWEAGNGPRIGSILA